MIAVKNGPVMEDRTCHPSSMAHVTDDLAPAHLFPRPNPDVRHVQVFSQKPSAMIDDHHVPVVIKSSGQTDNPVI